ncbi:glycosyltransferase [Chitiniphilus purpureus]|uniref:Glycosyltransferase n=1 Tax=Chitiniphilus purpureus TaxID=2981137 RepID=A0ABY6DN31_9NEIS|nr:glycosyltransferase family 2 protein [Chitiniphilus sp. CD1]UXY15618.1 glycosyltransferase [Chitiniphilus sp. CD1]
MRASTVVETRRPTLAIVTVCYNAGNQLEDTIRSIRTQISPADEYWIVDGGSTDRTLEIIKNHADYLTGWITEPDHGIADAMNKGWRRCTSDYILFLHAGDLLIGPKSLAEARAHIDGSASIYAFSILFGLPSDLRLSHSRSYSPWTRLKMPFRHQGVFCHRHVFEQLGGFAEDLRINMDYEFFLQAYLRGYPAKVIHLPLSIMPATGISSRQDWPSIMARLTDEQRIHWRNQPPLHWRLIYQLWWVLYPVYRRWRSRK